MHRHCQLTKTKKKYIYNRVEWDTSYHLNIVWTKPAVILHVDSPFSASKGEDRGNGQRLGDLKNPTFFLDFIQQKKAPLKRKKKECS